MKQTVKNITPKLLAFLKEHKAVKNYLDAVNEQNPYFIINDYKDVINQSFTWRKTAQDADYWYRLCNLYDSSAEEEPSSSFTYVADFRYRKNHGGFTIGCQKFRLKDLWIIVEWMKQPCLSVGSLSPDLSNDLTVEYLGEGHFKLGRSWRFTKKEINDLLRMYKKKLLK